MLRFPNYSQKVILAPEGENPGYASAILRSALRVLRIAIVPKGKVPFVAGAGEG